MEIYWLFLIPAIICALFADKMDQVVHADKKLKKVILALCTVLLLISALFILKSIS